MLPPGGVIRPVRSLIGLVSKKVEHQICSPFLALLGSFNETHLFIVTSSMISYRIHAPNAPKLLVEPLAKIL